MLESFKHYYQPTSTKHYVPYFITHNFYYTLLQLLSIIQRYNSRVNSLKLPHSAAEENNLRGAGFEQKKDFRPILAADKSITLKQPPRRKFSNFNVPSATDKPLQRVKNKISLDLVNAQRRF